MRSQALQHLEIKLVALVPPANRAGGQRKMRIGDDAFRIEEADMAQAIAARARTHRVVERKKPRLELGQRISADRAGEFRREQMLLAAVHFNSHRAAVRMAQ